MRTSHPVTRSRWLLAALLLTGSLSAAAQQPVDQEYSAKIREYTTEPFFLTPLVDHLPASATVPTPLEVLGHIAGAGSQDASR